MTVNEHSRKATLDWEQKEKNNDSWDIYNLKQRQGNLNQSTRELRERQLREKVEEETGKTALEVSRRSRAEIEQEKITQRKEEISQGNRLQAEQGLKKSKSKLSRREYRKVLVNADKDFGVRKKSDPLGLARISNRDMKAVPNSVLFRFDLSKVPSSRRRRLKAVRSQNLATMSNSKKEQLKSGLFKGKKNLQLKPLRTKDYSKRDKELIDRLRGVSKNSPTKARAKNRSISNTGIFKKKRRDGR